MLGQASRAPTNFTPSRVEEVVWDRHTFLGGQIANDGAVAVCDPTPLPRPHAVAFDPLAEPVTQQACNDGVTAQCLYDLSILHTWKLPHTVDVVKPYKSCSDSGGRSAHAVAMSTGQGTPYMREVGARLRLTREALGYRTRPDMLRDLFARADVASEAKALYNWEAGLRQPDLEFVHKLKSWRGITFEWVFDGDMSGLPKSVYDQIAKHRRESA
jgi:transcriptional regulator with XRE-family HTH domain